MLTDYATSELTLLGASTLELFALAVQITTEKHPDAFGESPGTEATAQRMAELKERVRNGARIRYVQHVEEEGEGLYLAIAEAS